MNIQILDSWLRQHLKTRASAKEIAEKMSLSSISIERVYPWKNGDFQYDIEITTNRPDMASVIGLAREASAVLPQNGIHATFVPPVLPTLANIKRHPGVASTTIGSQKDSIASPQNDKHVEIDIKSDPALVHRICCVVMEVTVKDAPEEMKNRLEAAGIRSLNNLIDITNYVMREIGHPTHVFDFDRLNTKTLTIRESKKGEEIVTLDNKKHVLPGGDIIMEDDKGRIIDLISIIGLENSVVTSETKRILFFIDNAERHHLRKTSMSLAIRSEAAQLNEKGIDPELSMDALKLGIKLYQEHAAGKIISDIYDIYPDPVKSPEITITEEKINEVIGVAIPLEKSVEILTKLGFEVKTSGKTLTAKAPSWRAHDMSIPEDLIEEVARVFGYHNIPTKLPTVDPKYFIQIADNPYYWEKRVKDAMKYWGYTEVYTYSMVSEELYDGPIEEAVAIANPLNEEFVYMRSSLILSLLQVLTENKSREEIKIFEIANVYRKNGTDLPIETRMMAGVVKKPGASFYEVKGLIEQLLKDLSITHVMFKPADEITNGAYIMLGNKTLGTIEILDDTVVNFELDFDELITHANNKKVYTPLAKYPPVIEDISVILGDDVLTGDVIEKIYKQSKLIKDVSLFDRYKSSRSFRITYQDQERNLTSEDVAPIRIKITHMLEDVFDGKIKE